MEYKNVIATLKQAVKDLTPKQRYAKVWHRKDQSSRARFKEGTQLPKPDPIASATRATILCAAIAHSRGRMHFTRVGHDFDYNAKEALAGNNTYDLPKGPEGLAKQRKWVEGAIKGVRRMADWAAKYPDRTWNIALSEEEIAMVEFLLDAGDNRHLRRDGTESPVDLRGAQSPMGM